MLNVVEPPRMAGEHISNEFRRKAKLVATECTGRTFCGVPAGVFCALLAVSERTGMSVMISSSEICVMHKSRR